MPSLHKGKRVFKINQFGNNRNEAAPWHPNRCSQKCLFENDIDDLVVLKPVHKVSFLWYSGWATWFCYSTPPWPWQGVHTPPRPLPPLPSWCLGVGPRTRIAQQRTAREGQDLATGPPESRSSCCKRNLMACPHPAPDEITSDLGKVTRPTCWFVHTCERQAGQPATKKENQGSLGPAPPPVTVFCEPGEVWNPFHFLTPNRTHTKILISGRHCENVLGIWRG